MIYIIPIVLVFWALMWVFKHFVATRCKHCKRWFWASELEIFYTDNISSCSATDMSESFYLCKKCADTKQAAVDMKRS